MCDLKGHALLFTSVSQPFYHVQLYERDSSAYKHLYAWLLEYVRMRSRTSPLRPKSKCNLRPILLTGVATVATLRKRSEVTSTCARAALNFQIFGLLPHSTSTNVVEASNLITSHFHL